MMAKKDYDDADLFLYFIRRTREHPDRPNPRHYVSFGTYPVDYLSDDKYKCAYCGCEYVYRRSLISHLKKLHNITNAQ